jgi:hypothetical protein
VPKSSSLMAPDSPREVLKLLVAGVLSIFLALACAGAIGMLGIAVLWWGLEEVFHIMR